jgi:allophanate hydrolase
MSSPPFTIGGLRNAYREGELTPLIVAKDVLRRVAASPDPAIWISRMPEELVLARAQELTGHSDPGSMPLYGVPFAVKDNIDCAGVPTTAGCPAFAYEPARSAPVVERLLAAGAMLIGKTNLDQFATGLVGTRSPHGAPRCVFDRDYVSGGSSSGSAVAVASGLVAFALGTDTAGSGRVPAAFNNIVGVKPSRGLISTRGVVPACRTLDCVSIFAHSVADGEAVLRIVSAFDAEDPYSRNPSPRYPPGDDFRFGILPPGESVFRDEEEAELYQRAVFRLRGLGGEPVPFDFASFREAGALLYEGAWTAERLSTVRQFIGRHEADMDPVVRRIIAGADRSSAVDAFEDQYRLAALRRRAELEWARIEFMLLPTVPGQPSIAEVEAEPIAANARLGRYTNFVNLLDCCAIAVPAGFRRDGLAVGVSFVAPAGADFGLMRLADRFHRASASGMGASRELALPQTQLERAQDDDAIELLVIGAHLSGMPLNAQLRALGATFRSEVRTSGNYRLYVLPRTTPAKPGLVRDSGFAGPGIAGEVWLLRPEAFGRFVDEIPAPLGIGKVTLSDGAQVSGFLCEAYAIVGAPEITEFGGWRAYIAGKVPPVEGALEPVAVHPS